MFVGVITEINAAGNTTTVFACSDFQPDSTNIEGKNIIQDILLSMSADNITSADGFLCAGDYDQESFGSETLTTDGISSVKDALKDVVTENMVFIQGNHDTAIGTAAMSPSGNNDPVNGEYGVFVINEDDYMWYNNNEEIIKRTAQNLINYLNEKIEEEYNKPIFVVSHLPLHYNMRTKNDGDGMHANYIFDVLNEAGEKGLNIIFLFGHNHSNGWDDYLGGASIYLPKGDSILIAQNSRTDFETEILNFTYMNAGYIGYYRLMNAGVDAALTMTVFQISDTEVHVKRYDSEGLHVLKASGVRNEYKNETAYNPDTTEYISPQKITLTNVTDKTPIENIINNPTSGESNRYIRITSVDELEEGREYLLVYNSSSDHIMLPKVVSKSNGSTDRKGFDIESTSAFGADVVYGEYTDKHWSFVKANTGWLLGSDGKNVVLTDTESIGIAATLEEQGDVLSIGGSADAFTFFNGSYYLNYNSRGVINGYASNPAAFYIYKLDGYAVNVINGIATDKDGKKISVANEGDTIILNVDESSEDDVFEKWQVTSGNVTLVDAFSKTTTFTMPAAGVEIKAVFKTVEAPNYSVTEGENEIWTQGNVGALNFTVNGPKEKFSELRIDGQKLTDSSYILGVSGNQTEISLKLEYLTTLFVGKHTITFVYTDGECSAQFEIKEAVVDNRQEYIRVADISELKDGGRYLLVYNANEDRFMIPKVVTRSSGSGTRTGFETETTSAFGNDVVYGEYTDKEWILKQSNKGWLLGKDEKNVALTNTSGEKIKATLETTGNVFVIGGIADRYTFITGNYNLNYNDSRRLINGYEGTPAEFYIYKLAEYKIDVMNGTAQNEAGYEIDEAFKGLRITLKADEAPEGQKFERWMVVTGDAVLKDEKSEITTFVMPEENVEIKAIYKEVEIIKPVYHITNGNNSTWNKNSAGGLGFTSDGQREKFCGVKINGQEIENSNYLVKDDDMVVVLKDKYLNNLGKGVYTITFVFTDGECGATFKVKQMKSMSTEENREKNNRGEGGSVDNSEKHNMGGGREELAPATADNEKARLWIGLMIFSISVGMLGIVNEKK